MESERAEMEKKAGGKRAGLRDGGKSRFSMQAHRQASGTEITSSATDFTFCRFASITGR